MDDLQLVGMVQPDANLPQDSDAGRDLHGPRLHFAIGEQLTLEEGHDEIDQPVFGLTEPHDVADVGVIEPHGEPRLAA